MIILGIDPGSRITGYGLIKKEAHQTKHIDNGIISTIKAKNFADRLLIIYEGIQKIIQSYQAEIFAIEDIFYAKNVKSTIKLAHARGVSLLAASKLCLPLYEYTPLAVKKAIVGYGRATKDQVQKMVRVHLNLQEVAEENASDALAVALCHAQSEKINQFNQLVQKK